MKTIMRISVHSENESPIYGESAIHIALDDEAGGIFLVLKQTANWSADGEIRVEVSEWAEINAAVLNMIAQPAVHDHKDE